jgi:hypothetical protein
MPLSLIHQGLAYWRACCRLFGINQLNRVELQLGPHALRRLRWRFRNRRLGGESVSKLIFCLCFLKFPFGCTHLCWFCHVLPVLLSNPISWVIATAVIVKYIVFYIYLLSSVHGIPYPISTPKAVKDCKIYSGLLCVYHGLIWLYSFELFITCPLGPYFTGLPFIVSLPFTGLRIILSGDLCRLAQCMQTKHPYPYIPFANCNQSRLSCCFVRTCFVHHVLCTLRNCTMECLNIKFCVLIQKVLLKHMKCCEQFMGMRLCPEHKHFNSLSIFKRAERCGRRPSQWMTENDLQPWSSEQGV